MSTTCRDCGADIDVDARGNVTPEEPCPMGTGGGHHPEG